VGRNVCYSAAWHWRRDDGFTDVEGHTPFIDEISFTLLLDKRMNQMNMCQL